MKEMKIFNNKQDATMYWRELVHKGYSADMVVIGSYANVKTNKFEYTVFVQEW